MKDEANLKSLDGFSRRYLLGEDPNAKVVVAEGNNAEAQAKIIEAYRKQVQEDFIQRAGGFAEDLIGFIIEQKSKRGLDNYATIFALALANINLHGDFCIPRNEKGEKILDGAKREALINEWDDICYAAQCYYNDNAEKS